MIQPERLSDSITLYEGDCFEVLPTLVKGSIDAVITDPPYLMGAASTRRGDRPQSPLADWINAARWYAEWLGQCFRVAKPTAPVWVFGNWRTIPVIEIAVQSLARSITSVVVWDKQWIGVGSMNGLRKQYECVFLMGGPEFKIKDRSIGDIWPEKWSSQRPHGHSAEKPVGLIRRMISVSGIPTGSRILDPFAGSGTTLEAAHLEGCEATGCELDTAYCQVIRDRVRRYEGKAPGSLLTLAPEPHDLFAGS